MSHFTVLVPAADEAELASKLAPFHEFECTGHDDQYVQDIDITDKVKSSIEKQGSLEEGLSWYGLENRVVSDEGEIDRTDKHKYGYAVVQDSQLVKAIDRTNPNKKWDWWRVGGRWSGLLNDKDSELAGNVDWNAIYESYRSKEISEWHNRQSYLKTAKAEKSAPDEVFNKANELWNADHKPRQEAVRETFGDFDTCLLWLNAENLADKNGDHHWFDEWKDIKKYLMSEVDYLATLHRIAQTFAFIDLEGHWNQRGEMGWWGMVDEEEGTNNYDEAWWKFVESLPAHQRMYVVDCHI